MDNGAASSPPSLAAGVATPSDSPRRRSSRLARSAPANSNAGEEGSSKRLTSSSTVRSRTGSSMTTTTNPEDTVAARSPRGKARTRKRSGASTSNGPRDQMDVPEQDGQTQDEGDLVTAVAAHAMSIPDSAVGAVEPQAHEDAMDLDRSITVKEAPIDTAASAAGTHKNASSGHEEDAGEAGRGLANGYHLSVSVKEGTGGNSANSASETAGSSAEQAPTQSSSKSSRKRTRSDASRQGRDEEPVQAATKVSGTDASNVRLLETEAAQTNASGAHRPSLPRRKKARHRKAARQQTELAGEPSSPYNTQTRDDGVSQVASPSTQVNRSPGKRGSPARFSSREKGKGRAEPDPPATSTATSASMAQLTQMQAAEVEILRAQLRAAEDSLKEQQSVVSSLTACMSCGVCMEPLRNPLALACGHVFCQDDLWNWFHRVSEDSDPDDISSDDEDENEDDGEEDGWDSDSSVDTDPDEVEHPPRRRHLGVPRARPDTPSHDSGSSDDDGLWMASRIAARNGSPASWAQRLSPAEAQRRINRILARAENGHGGSDDADIFSDEARNEQYMAALIARVESATAEQPRAARGEQQDSGNAHPAAAAPVESSGRTRDSPGEIIVISSPSQPARREGDAPSTREVISSSTVSAGNAVRRGPYAGLRPGLAIRGARRSIIPPAIFEPGLEEQAANAEGLQSTTGSAQTAADTTRTEQGVAMAAGSSAPTAEDGNRPRRIPARQRAKRRNLVCPQCRARVSVPPHPIFVVREIADVLNRHVHGRRAESLALDTIQDAGVDETWGGLFSAAAVALLPGAAPRRGNLIGPTGVERRALRDFEAATRRMAHRAASEAVAAAQRAARDSRAVDRHHTAMDVERDAQIAQSFLESLQSAVPVRANDDRQQGSRQQQGHPEGNERRNHRSGPSTGRDILRQGILDEEDRVRRCIECGWEIDGKECARCRTTYDTDSEFEEEGESLTGSTPANVRRYYEQAELEEGSSFIVPDDEMEEASPPERRRVSRRDGGRDAASRRRTHPFSSSEEELEGTEKYNEPVRRAHNGKADEPYRSPDGSGEEEEGGEDLMAGAETSSQQDAEDDVTDADEEDNSDVVPAPTRGHRRTAQTQTRSKKRHVYLQDSDDEEEEEVGSEEEEAENNFIDDSIQLVQPKRQSKSSRGMGRGTEQEEEDESSEAVSTDRETRRARREERRQAKKAAALLRSTTRTHGSSRRVGGGRASSESEFTDSDSGDTSEESDLGTDDDEEDDVSPSTTASKNSPPTAKFGRGKDDGSSKTMLRPGEAAARAAIARQKAKDEEAAFALRARSDERAKRFAQAGISGGPAVAKEGAATATTASNSTGSSTASSYKKRVIVESDDE